MVALVGRQAGKREFLVRAPHSVLPIWLLAIVTIPALGPFPVLLPA